MSAMQNPNMPVTEKKPNQIQNRILEAALTTKSILRITMQNGTQYFGKLHDYDQFVLSLIPFAPVGNGREQGFIMIYKSAIASLEMSSSVEKIVTSHGGNLKRQGQKQMQNKQEPVPQLAVKSLEPELNEPEEETPNAEEIAKEAINDEANKLNESAQETEEPEVTNETSSETEAMLSTEKKPVETEEQTDESIATEVFSFDEPEITEATEATSLEEEKPVETKTKIDEPVVAEAFSFNEPEVTEEAKATETTSSETKVTSTETQEAPKEENKEEKKDGFSGVLAELGI